MKIGIITISLLLIPLIAMQFTDEVNWNFMDFIIGGALIFLTGLFLKVVLTKIKNAKYRMILILTIIVVFLLIWAELAVGIFGTPFSGS